MLTRALTAILMILVLTLPRASRAETINIYSDDNYYPIVAKDPNHPERAIGILPKIFEMVSAKSGDVYNIIPVPWLRAISESVRDTGGITTISWTPERDKIYDYSVPIYDDTINLVVLKSRKLKFDSIADLSNMRVAGQEGASYGEARDAEIREGTFSVMRDNNGHILRLLTLLAGNIDYALMGNGYAGFEVILNSDPVLAKRKNEFELLPKPFVIDKLYLAFAKTGKHQEQLHRFNAAFAEVKKTAEYKKLIFGK